MSRKTILISPVDGKIYNYFKDIFNVIESDCLQEFIHYERFHADMQALNLNGNLFVNGSCKGVMKSLNKLNAAYTICDDIGSEYPDNVALNAALVGDKLLCKANSLHPRVKEYCIENNIQILNVNQGYTKCSTLILNNNALITDDESIEKVSLINNINVLKIRKGDIFLDDKTVGFIGGASAVVDDTVYFFGDITTHRDAYKIIEFLSVNKMNYQCVSAGKLIDIGGIVNI